MSLDIEAVLKALGGQVADTVKANVKAAAIQLTPEDLAIVERAGQRKAELLLARLLGEDTKEAEKQIDATLGFLASKAAAIAKETINKTVLEVVQQAGTFILNLAFSAVIP